MRIELTDDNGMINNGVPTLVVLVIDGKTRIPYEATKTIQDVYADIKKLKVESISEPIEEVRKEVSSEEVYKRINNNEIERGDIVKCVKAYPRDEGVETIVVGGEYRILDIKKKNGKVVQYDILDDNADMQIRIAVFPEEVELLRKREKQPPRSVVPSVIKKCGHCKEENALLKVSDGRYEGTCELCGAKLIEMVGKNV